LFWKIAWAFFFNFWNLKKNTNEIIYKDKSEQVWTSLNKSEQVWTSLDKSGHLCGVTRDGDLWGTLFHSWLSFRELCKVKFFFYLIFLKVDKGPGMWGQNWSKALAFLLLFFYMFFFKFQKLKKKAHAIFQNKKLSLLFCFSFFPPFLICWKFKKK
jgi:high-affinity Fe2+/Pb2+ permease